MALIEIRNLVSSFASQAGPVINNITLSVESGEYIALIGANGSGKTTLVRHLNALHLPASGSVLVKGLSTSDPENHFFIRKRIGMVFQSPEDQIVAATVEDEVAFGLENIGYPEEGMKSAVSDALRKVGMEHSAGRSPFDLSPGELQRVAAASVLAMKPECVIFDEAGSMVDPRGRSALMKIMETLKEEGIAVITVTHEMDEAVEADRVIILQNGKIAADGPPARVFMSFDIEQFGLAPPEPLRFSRLLQSSGIAIPEALTAGDLASSLDTLRKKIAVSRDKASS